MTKPLKDMTKNDLIETALNEPGKISNCYSLFHDYSVMNSYLLALQQHEKGLEVTPVMAGSKWVKAGIVSQETINRLKARKQGLWARIVSKGKTTKDKFGRDLKDKDGNLIEREFTYFPFAQAFFSYSQFKKSEILQAHKVAVEIDFNTVVDKLGLQLIEWGLLEGNAQGYCRPNKGEIAINPVAENPQKTFFHEVAHCLLHKIDEELIDSITIEQSIKEVEAELVAYICSVMTGASEDDLANSRGYIQGWLSRAKEPLSKYNTDRVCACADIIMKAAANHKGNYNPKNDLRLLTTIKKENKGE